jgi:hypothetical protein
LYKILDKVYAAHIPALLLVLRDASDRALRDPARLLRRHTGCNVLFNKLVQVETKFGCEFEVDIWTAAQRSKSQTGFV